MIQRAEYWQLPAEKESGWFARLERLLRVARTLATIKASEAKSHNWKS
jgi:hypothetical protein